MWARTDSSPAATQADELSAATARGRLRLHDLPTLDAEPPVADLLRPDEVIHALRTVLATGTDAVAAVTCLTSQRVIVIRATVSWMELDAIADAIVIRGFLVLVDHDGSALWVDVERPRTWRVAIASARAVVRRHAREGCPSTGPSAPFAE